jgi:hypothetical protein
LLFVRMFIDSFLGSTHTNIFSIFKKVHENSGK